MTDTAIPASKTPWTVLAVANGLGEEQARELLNENIELRLAIKKFIRIGFGNSMSHELQAEAHNYALDLLTRIRPMVPFSEERSWMTPSEIRAANIHPYDVEGYAG